MTTAADEVERVARLSWGRLVARLSRRTGNPAAAADALADALVAALTHWPRQGIPDRPEAWLTTAALNAARSAGRRQAVAAAAETHLALLAEERATMAEAATPDRLLDLMFVCAHPAIDRAVRTPLMLQLVLGLDVRRMSGAFLIAPDTLSRRLSRAKAKIAAVGIAFAVPQGPDLSTRTGHVLDAIYAAFTVGSDAADDDRAAALGREALWLGSVLAAATPDAAGAQALLALMLYATARRPARTDAAGRFVPLAAQDPARWDAALMDAADLAMRLAARAPTPGRYQLEAAIAAAHAARRSGVAADPAAIVTLYRGLVALYPTAGAAVGLAGALLQAGDAAGALTALDAVPPDRAAGYQPWWALRAEALRRAGDRGGAVSAVDRAILLSRDPVVTAYLGQLRRAMMH